MTNFISVKPQQLRDLEGYTYEAAVVLFRDGSSPQDCVGAITALDALKFDLNGLQNNDWTVGAPF